MGIALNRTQTDVLGIVAPILAACIAWFVLTGLGYAGEQDLAEEPLRKALAPLIGHRDALLVVGTDGRTLLALNADTPLVPASILKLLTASAALDQLGTGYRFETRFYLDHNKNLKIKGFGDPLLISERLTDIAAHLAVKISAFHDIILDDSYVAQPVVIPGRGKSDEPYDAPNGALCVNFNTVAFRRDRGRWVSDEPQTPLLPSVIPKIKASGLVKGRITLAANSDESLNYTGEIFQYFLNQAGIRIQGVVRKGVGNPDKEHLLWRYLSRSDLSQVVAKLLEFSNNFIANQVLLVMGAHQAGQPATMGKGLSVLQHYYHQELGIQTGRVVEASGISRQNRLTAQAMATILERFAPHYQLLRHKKRQFYKTGHLKSVRTRAGYLTSANGGLYRFVVMINTPGKSTNIIMRILEDNLE